MNILTDALPLSVDIGGKQYPIRADHKTALRVIMAFEDNSLTNYEKVTIMLANLYPTIPTDPHAAIERAGWFLNGGQESKEAEGLRVYSFGKDANLIYAAFRQTHGVDLQATELHWWEFLALFMDLGSETAFCNLVSLRKRVKTGKATKDERQAAFQMGDAFDLPDLDDRTLEEREIEAKYLQAIEQAQRNK